jgi:hypothetical protein
MTVFAASPQVAFCRGCFGCWIKTPGRCVIPDRAGAFVESISRHRNLAIVSRLTFGGLSAPVKAVLDRSIGFMQPFFELRENSMRHKRRHPRSPNLHYFFHGDDGRDSAQRETAVKLAEANRLNFMAPEVHTTFLTSLSDLKDGLNRLLRL